MSVEVIEVQIPFAGIEAIAVEVVTAHLPGTGDPDIPATLTPPANPRDGQPWRESGTFILSFWDATEGAWFVSATTAGQTTPSNAVLDDLDAPILDDTGAFVLFAA